MADPKSTMTVGDMVRNSVVGHGRPDLVAEAYRRNLLPPQKAQAFEEAVKRGVVTADGDTKALIDARAQLRQRADAPMFGVLGGPKSGDVGRTSTSMVNSMLFGLGDEISGAAAAAKTAASKLIGKDPGYTAAQAYAATRQAEMEDAKAYAQRHPVANTAATVVGAASGPGVAAGARYAAKGATLAAKVGRGALVGGTLGAASGAGNASGGLRSRAAGAAVGGATGAALGGALPVVGAVGGKVARGAANVVSDAARAGGRIISGTPLNVTVAPTADEARNALAQVANLARSSGADPAAITAAATSGKPVTLAEVLGRPAVTHAAAVARRAGTTPDNMEALLSVRSEQAPSRLMGDFQSLTGITPMAAKGSMDDIVATGRARAGPLFDAALASPEPVWNADLAKLSERPAIQSAMKQASVDLRNAGKDPVGMGLAIDPDTGAPMVGDDLQAVTTFQPTAEAWDATKKALAGQIERDAFGHPLPDTASRGNYGIRMGDKALTGALRDSIPGYGEALDTSGDYLRLSDAFQKGQSLFADPKVSAADFAAHLETLGPSERDAFVGGVGNSLYGKGQQGLLTAKKMQVPVYADKLRAIMGDGADDWASRLQSEVDMSKAANRMSPGSGSPTFELANAAGEQDSNAVGDAIKIATQATHNKAGALATLFARGAAYGGTSGTSVGMRNALGDIYTAAPSSDFGQQLHDLLTQIQVQKGNPAFSPTLASAIPTLFAQNQ